MVCDAIRERVVAVDAIGVFLTWAADNTGRVTRKLVDCLYVSLARGVLVREKLGRHGGHGIVLIGYICEVRSKL